MPRLSAAGSRSALIAVVAGLLLGACGGGSTKAAGGSDDATIAHGRALFGERCAGCHTLTAAGARGAAANPNRRERVEGPNLDYRRVSVDDALFAIRNGGFSGEIMPRQIVTGHDAEAVARFVAKYAGSHASVKPGERINDPKVRQMSAVAPGSAAPPPAGAASAGADEQFLRAAFDSAQEMWTRTFRSADAQYVPARLVFFHSTVQTRCGEQSAQTGPFYCPGDYTVYLNTDFFRALAHAYGLSSPFAAGYVTAHEVGHHVQQLLGLHARVAATNEQDPSGANDRSVRVELQADCYAGIWLHGVANAGALGEDDIAHILGAAAVVGDDFRRNRAGAELAPETWTHGSSEQRVHWVSVGKSSGAPADCDTFGPGQP